MEQRRRFKFLRTLARFVATHPIWVLSVSAILTVASVWVTVTHLGFQSNRNDLISDRLDWNKRFINWQKTFSSVFDMYVVVDGGGIDEASREKAKLFVQDLGAKLSTDPHVERVVFGFEQQAVSPRAMRLLPMDKFKHRLDQIEKARTLLESASPVELITGTLAEMSKASGRPETSPAASQPATQKKAASQELNEAEVIADMHDFARMIDGFTKVLSTPVDKPVDFSLSVTPPDDLPTAWQYMDSENGRLFFMRVSPRLNRAELDAFGMSIAAIRKQMQEALKRHPGVSAGVTGVDVVESDETVAATWDSTWTAAVAAVLILLLLVVAFHSWRTPLLSVGSLIVGITWSFGFLTITIGHLQVLSSVFTLLLLGLGIAYGIHLASAYELLRHDYPDNDEGFAQTIEESFERMGPGILTGAVTTAAAFGTTLVTDFQGVAEMGFIAAFGVGLCLIAMLTVFPASLWAFKRDHKHVTPVEDRTIHFFREKWVMPFVRNPWTTLIAALLVTIVSGWQMTKLQFDYDLLKLQPQGVESVVWQDRIVDQGGQSIWFAVSVCKDIEEARQRAAQFRSLSTVDDVKGVGLLFPGDETQKVKLIEASRSSFGSLLDDSDAPKKKGLFGGLVAPSLQTSLNILKFAMDEAMKEEMPAPVKAALKDVATSVNRCASALMSDKLTGEERAARIARLEREYLAFRKSSRKQIAVALDPAPLQITDLPPEVMNEYLARDKSGQVTLEIFPKMPSREGKTPADIIDSPLDVRFLPKHVAELKSIDPLVTGISVQVYESGHMIKDSYTLAGILGFVLVFILVWIGFSSFKFSVVAIVPVAVGFALTFAVMHWVGMKINLANIVVLPLMFGIGVDAGVHMINRYRMEPSNRPLGLTSGTGKGITVTSLTTIISFGVMIFASHRGISDLGFVLAVGMTLTKLSCWVVMPALLEVIQRRKERLAAQNV